MDPWGSDGAPSTLQNGWTGALWAAMRDHFEALRTLLAAGANLAGAVEVRGEEEG